MLESRKAHSAENYCRGLIFAPFAPGGKISKSIPLETCCVRAWNSLSAAVESWPKEIKEGNDRRIYGRCQTNAELRFLLLFLRPPSPRTVFVSPFYWLAQDRSPSGSYYYQPSFGSSLLSASMLLDVFIRLLVCSCRMGSWRGWKIAMVSK